MDVEYSEIILVESSDKHYIVQNIYIIHLYKILIILVEYI